MIRSSRSTSTSVSSPPCLTTYLYDPPAVTTRFRLSSAATMAACFLSGLCPLLTAPATLAGNLPKTFGDSSEPSDESPCLQPHPLEPVGIRSRSQLLEWCEIDGPVIAHGHDLALDLLAFVLPVRDRERHRVA